MIVGSEEARMLKIKVENIIQQADSILRKVQRKNGID